MLESEADMLVTFGVSRGTLREALRLLESQGLVQLKPGPRGGPVVGVPDPAYLGKTISLFLRMMGATYDDLCECMILVAPRMTELAARNCDKEEARVALAPWLKGEERVDDAGFHRIVYGFSGNPVLAMFITAIESLLLEHMLPAITRDFEYVVHDEHIELARAIVAKQRHKSRRLMDVHAKKVADFCRSNNPAMVNQPVEWR